MWSRLSAGAAWLETPTGYFGESLSVAGLPGARPGLRTALAECLPLLTGEDPRGQAVPVPPGRPVCGDRAGLRAQFLLPKALSQVK